MAIKNLIEDAKNAVAIAQAGIKAALKSVKQTQSKAKKRTARKPTPKKVASSGTPRKPKAKRKPMAKARKSTS